MYCDTFDIPDEILMAQEQGKLVVFAGAGVSMGRPSGLPSFAELAGLLAQDTDLTPTEPYDLFLSDLAATGVDVPELCRRIIADPASKHTQLHEDLLRIFLKEDLVRVVTTNFDLHFSAAADALKWKIPVYTAPVLPLGRDFAGIVHLHGAISDPQKRFVLTGGDFGEAYLTEGWASTFLRSLFAEFLVLFVGYGHTDPTMNYLGRGLANRGGTRRYSLTSARQPWFPLGITPILFEELGDDDRFANLGVGVRRWAELTEMTPLESEARVKECLSISDAMEPSKREADFLVRCLQKADTANYFVQNARGWRWVMWLQQVDLIGRFLIVEWGVGSAADRTVAVWLGAELAAERTGKGLLMVQRNGGRVGGVVANHLAQALITRPDVDLSLPRTADWAILLTKSGGSPVRAGVMGDLVMKVAGQNCGR